MPGIIHQQSRMDQLPDINRASAQHAVVPYVNNIDSQTIAQSGGYQPNINPSTANMQKPCSMDNCQHNPNHVNFYPKMEEENGQLKYDGYSDYGSCPKPEPYNGHMDLPSCSRNMPSSYTSENVDGAMYPTGQSYPVRMMNNFKPEPYLGMNAHSNIDHTSSMTLLTPKPEPASGMSLWTKTQQLPSELLKHVQTTYSTNFPIEIRHYFADWLEAQPWNQIDENDPNQYPLAQQLLDNLLEQVELKADELPLTQEFFLLKLKLQDATNNFKTLYQNHALDFVRLVKKCFSQEEQLIHQNENPTAAQDNSKNDMNALVMKKVEELQEKTQVTEQDLKQLQNKQELFIVQCQQQIKVNMQLSQIQQQPTSKEREEKLKQFTEHKKGIEKELTNQAEELLKSTFELADKHTEIFNGLEELQKQIVEGELITWKRKQQFSGNGAPFDKHLLDTLQTWIEALAEMIWKNRQQILRVEMLIQRIPINIPDAIKNILPELNQKITGLLSSLVTSTFIVESQPPQVLKKEARFSARVRLLVGGKLNIHMSPPQVKASIISENQARNLLKNDSKSKQETSGEILNNQGMMEYHRQKGELSIEFRNMQLKRIKRADRRGAESVTEEKFCILFQSDFQIGNGELMFQVWTLSLPVVVTVHGNQECNAMATILWDNQFNEPGRTPFVVPEQVPWPAMAELLDTKFASVTGRGLNHNNKQYLATKLFGGTTNDDFSSKLVSWSMFNRDPLQCPPRNFSFWEWFFQVMKLVREHLKLHWTDGTVIGFISKQDSQDLLSTTSAGTFLLRFSDNFIGGVTIAWVSDDPNTGEKKVWNLHPYCARDFGIRCLADRIKDLPSLVNLYPSTPKANAFGKYYTNMAENMNRGVDDYIRTLLIATIPNGIPGVNNIENPDTPGSYGFPDSPASTVYSQGPISPKQDVSTTSTSNHVEQMDSNIDLDMDIPMLGVTDYNADDMFNDINVNELLYNSREGATAAANLSTAGNFPATINDTKWK